MYPSSLSSAQRRCLSLDDGASTSAWRARIPFRIRARKSEMGSVIDIFNHLPARFDDARNVAPQSEVAEADPAEVELAQERARAATLVAAVAMPNTPLRRLLVGGKVDGLGHGQFLKGMPKCFRSARP